MSEASTRRAERQPEPAAARDDRRHLDALLDAALEATFPASDPLAVSTPRPAADAPGKKAGGR